MKYFNKFHENILIKKLLVVPAIILCVFTISLNKLVAQGTAQDSVDTAFRKGRWLSGFSGFISSASTKNTSEENNTISNNYRIEISLGKFIKDRINLGINVNMERNNIEGNEVRTSEDIFIGPKGTYYFSKSKIGSLYLSFSPGFIVYRDKTILNQNNDPIENINKGNGWGTITTMGYSYVIFDLVAFDLGLNWSAYRINITQSSSQNANTNDTNFILNDLSFSFGFKIFLGI
jgi:hypothetical protein